MVSKEKLKEFMDSPIFEDSKYMSRDSGFILKRIKDNVMLNIDKEGVDPVDLFHWAISLVFQESIKSVLSDMLNSRKGKEIDSTPVEEEDLGLLC